MTIVIAAVCILAILFLAFAFWLSGFVMCRPL